MNAVPGHFSVDDRHEPLETICGYAMRSEAIGNIIRTSVTCFAHRVIFFYAEFIVTSHRFVVWLTDSGAWMDFYKAQSKKTRILLCI